jgi:hypothetical protein
MTADDRNCSGRTMNWLMPISASCDRSSRASALDSEAMTTDTSPAVSRVMPAPGSPPGNRTGEASSRSMTTRSMFSM